MWHEATAPAELEGAAIQASVISSSLMCTLPTSKPHPKTILQFLLKYLLPVSDGELAILQPVCSTSRQLFLFGSFSHHCQIQVPLSCKYLLSFYSPVRIGAREK